mmetsp:Transcript_22116/g.53587  ORF Transcript_22116/g.53587 Transcript_22116/m.53587 type:complete len:249 (-) Transcript_22116:157-903(-)
MTGCLFRRSPRRRRHILLSSRRRRRRRIDIVSSTHLLRRLSLIMYPAYSMVIGPPAAARRGAAPGPRVQRRAHEHDGRGGVRPPEGGMIVASSTVRRIARVVHVGAIVRRGSRRRCVPVRRSPRPVVFPRRRGVHGIIGRRRAGRLSPAAVMSVPPRGHGRGRGRHDAVSFAAPLVRSVQRRRRLRRGRIISVPRVIVASGSVRRFRRQVAGGSGVAAILDSAESDGGSGGHVGDAAQTPLPVGFESF